MARVGTTFCVGACRSTGFHALLTARYISVGKMLNIAECRLLSQQRTPVELTLKDISSLTTIQKPDRWAKVVMETVLILKPFTN